VKRISATAIICQFDRANIVETDDPAALDLLAFELRRPPRRHRGHTFLEVFGLVVRVLLHAFMRHGIADLVYQAAPQGGTGGYHRDRRGGGDLGRKLMKVDELMRRGDRNPAVESGSTLLFAIEVMTRTPGRPGATSITAKDGSLLGFFTDGDLRRLIERGLADPRTVRIDDVMTKNPRRISDETFALEALGIMRQMSIDQLPVVDAQQKLIGLLDVQDLLDLRIG
jgi:CBS domain-containing protein